MKLTDGIHYLMQEIGGRVHSFLLDDGDGVTLIDTLFDDDGGKVAAEIAAMGRQPANVKHIVLTHAHRSHIGGAAALRKLTGAPVLIHEWEAGILEGKRKATKVGLWPRKPYEVYALQVGLALGLRPHKPCSPDRSIVEGDRIGPLEVVATPGHTPGCLSFYWAEKRALFVGDVVVTWPKVEAGWEGLTLDNAENRRSVGKLAEWREAELLCVGHGAPIREGAAAVLAGLRDQKG
jgi:glyoxylase-like metal-dependent hydrolase (beta-lactamase superfamily II)